MLSSEPISPSPDGQPTTGMDHASPITTLPVELMTEIMRYLAVAADLNREDAIADLAAARLTSRRFYDTSWPAFGQLLATTNFDIRSTESMRSFKAISEKDCLKRHVKGLCLGAGRFTWRILRSLLANAEDNHASAHLTSLQDAFRRCAENVFCPDAWSNYGPDRSWKIYGPNDEGSHPLSGSAMSLESWFRVAAVLRQDAVVLVAKQGLATHDVSTFLSAVLSEFPTLSTIECRPMLPAIMQQVLTQQDWDLVEVDSRKSFREREVGELGLNVIFNALRTTPKFIQRLQFPVYRAFFSGFQTTVPEQLLREVLKGRVREIAVHEHTHYDIARFGGIFRLDFESPPKLTILDKISASELYKRTPIRGNAPLYFNGQ